MFEILSVCKGGGYLYCRTNPLHPKANSKGLYPLHRVLVENKLGRLLSSDEVVHHVDEDKNNNAVSNLEVKTNSQHSKDHAIAREAPVVNLSCLFCGGHFVVTAREAKYRLARTERKGLCCCISCSVKLYHSEKLRG